MLQRVERGNKKIRTNTLQKEIKADKIKNGKVSEKKKVSRESHSRITVRQGARGKSGQIIGRISKNKSELRESIAQNRAAPCTRNQWLRKKKSAGVWLINY